MAQSFWDAAAPLISATERHPFLVSMVDGTLRLENFQYYVIQDALYLTDFAECLRLLGDKMAAVNEEVVSKRLHRFAVAAEEDEKELHRSFFKRYIRSLSM
jgi:thiaminase/transcriptional activator TenA